jgi:glycosyltransferase involved in cell wall biosynthesis
MVPVHKLEVVPNGIDTSRFPSRVDRNALRATIGIPPTSPVIGTLGRFDEIKRQDRLIHGFERALRQITDAHLLLVGDGPLGGDLCRLTKKLGIEGRVHFVGYQTRPEDYLSTMDVFALTSQSEGMPLAILEAWASGLPVVVTRVGGLTELVEDDRTGLLVDPEDEVSLAEALVGLIADPTRARRFGGEGRRCVESRYSLRRMCQEYHRLYLSLNES